MEYRGIRLSFQARMLVLLTKVMRENKFINAFL